MAKEQTPPVAAEEADKNEGQAFFYRVKRWPRRRGEKRPMKPNATALGRAWVNGTEYDHVLITTGSASQDGVANVREERKPLTAALCKKVKEKIEKQWSGPNFEQGMEVEFRPVPKTQPVEA